MKIVILAAGYATRLYPLTLTQPKPLLLVAGRPMIDYVVESLAPIQEVDRIFVVTNNRFAGNFEEWAARRTVAPGGPLIQIVNDGSTDDKNKLGAIGDLDLVIRNERVDDDVIVVAGDN